MDRLPAHPSPPSGRHAPRSPITLDDLLSDLLWPKLLRAPALGLNPPRLIVAFLAVLLVGGVYQLAMWGDGRIMGYNAWERLARLPWPVGAGSIEAVAVPPGLWRAVVWLPIEAVPALPLTALVATPLALLVLIVAVATMSRMTAAEVARRASMPVSRGAGFALSRLPALVGAVAGPVVVVWGIAAVLILAGLVFMRVPGLNVVGAVLYGAALLASLAAVVMTAVYILAAPLLIPAVTCDGVDGFDAVQRSYAYVFGRPLRLVAYLVVLGLILWLSVSVASLLANWSVGFATDSMRTLGGERGGPTLIEGTLAGMGERPRVREDRERTDAIAATVVAFWVVFIRTLVWAFALSAAASGITVLYLIVRRVNDGQNTLEIWEPEAAPAHTGASPSFRPARTRDDAAEGAE